MSERWSRANSALEEARILLEADRPNGAVSRAYYAMFDAAIVALQSVSPALAEAKTHATILSRFSRHVVRDRGLDPELGRILRRTYDMRLRADYDGPPLTKGLAATIVDEADRFLDAIGKFIGDPS